MLSLALARRVGWGESRRRTTARLAAATPAAVEKSRENVVVTRQFAKCNVHAEVYLGSASAARHVVEQEEAGSVVFLPTALPLRETRPPWWTMTTARRRGGNHGGRCDDGWRSRRGLCGVAEESGTPPSPSEDRARRDEKVAAEAAGLGSGGAKGSAPGGGSAGADDGSGASGGGKIGKGTKGRKGAGGRKVAKGEQRAKIDGGGDERREEKPKQQAPKKRRPAVRKKKRSHPFGTPLSLLVPPPPATSVGADGVDVEDQLPDPRLIEVEKAGEDWSRDAARGRERGNAARTEVVHALSRGLVHVTVREVALTLSAYAGTSVSTEDTLAKLEELLARRPHQAEWAMPLIRAHLKDEEKPSSETHQEQLGYVRNVNAKYVSHEDMAESLLRSHRRHSWGPEMSKVKLEKDHPERWEEAMLLSKKMADRLPACRYQLVWETLQKYLQAEKTLRRFRLLKNLSTSLSSSTHLVLPAIANFWRVKELGSKGKLEAEIERTKKEFIEEQALLAKCLVLARRKSLSKVEDFNGAWSIEAQHELREARTRQAERRRRAKGEDSVCGSEEGNGEKHEDHDDFWTDIGSMGGVDDGTDGTDSTDGGGEPDRDSLCGEEVGEDADRLQERKKLEDAASKVISEALSPKIPTATPVVPMGVFELFVVEYPRQLNMPPPPDIFGGDSPVGFGTTGMSRVPAWGGRDVQATRGLKRSDQHVWPEEIEERREEEAWWQGAGEKELSPARAKDYQEVKDVLLTGKRRKRPEPVGWTDVEDDPAAIAVKAQLLKRSALVADLHPDNQRQIELQLEEEGSRTAFITGLPSGVSRKTVKEAFRRCGPVHQVIIKEPTFKEGGSDDSTGASPASKPKRAFGLKPPDPFAFSVPHGFVVFQDDEGFRRATGESFRIFGVHIEGATVTTRPAKQCRTVYVENVSMMTGGRMADAINEVLKPFYAVRLKKHFLGEETPQVVAIPLKSYPTARSVDKLLTKAGFVTTFHYIAPKVGDGKSSGNADVRDKGYTTARDWDLPSRPKKAEDEIMSQLDENLLRQAIDELHKEEERGAGDNNDREKQKEK